ncbi:MAG: hypothetical protein J6T03_06515 [Bacteroidales bacterium]|nr:hypothetical protein [Bacteroidales bacterium]
MNNPKRYDKRLLPMLWIGLILWIGSMAIMYFLESTGETPSGQERLMQMSKEMFRTIPVFTLLLLCFFQPILEELSFRLWGVGKKWTTIVCLVLMAVFVTSELKLVGLIFIVAFILVWVFVRNRVAQVWINTIITSLAFSLSHISGFGDFSLGMVLGLVDIFGLALVLCWLTININFWLAPLLHVLNNSVSILVPMLFVSDPITSSHSITVGPQEVCSYQTTVEPFRYFADNKELMSQDGPLGIFPADTTGFVIVGEPAQIACRLAARADSSMLNNIEWKYNYDWQSKNAGLEERVVFRVSDYSNPDGNYDFNNIFYNGLLNDYIRDVSRLIGDTIVADTTEIMVQEVWVVYDDGREELFGSDSPSGAWSKAMEGKVLFSKSIEENDSTITIHYYAYDDPHPSPLLDMRSTLLNTSSHDYRIEYRDSHKETIIIFK